MHCDALMAGTASVELKRTTMIRQVPETIGIILVLRPRDILIQKIKAHASNIQEQNGKLKTRYITHGPSRAEQSRIARIVQQKE